mmetsp:Transcript_15430/g.42414  ORF Transcript_15430/g.42414 Transcript_15430/m.42414 type:complete len:252 (+) Transcript_15430:535-1290(+)
MEIALECIGVEEAPSVFPGTHDAWNPLPDEVRKLRLHLLPKGRGRAVNAGAVKAGAVAAVWGADSPLVLCGGHGLTSALAGTDGGSHHRQRAAPWGRRRLSLWGAVVDQLDILCRTLALHVDAFLEAHLLARDQGLVRHVTEEVRTVCKDITLELFRADDEAPKIFPRPQCPHEHLVACGVALPVLCGVAWPLLSIVHLRCFCVNLCVHPRFRQEGGFFVGLPQRLQLHVHGDHAAPVVMPDFELDCLVHQ